MMTLEEIKNLGRQLTRFLRMFADCFASSPGRQLLGVYVKGQLSDIPRKNCEAIALRLNQAPRTLQRLLESIKWDEGKLRDRCQQIIARDHAHDEAIGMVDESGTAKSGSCTSAAARQYNGHRGKIENCLVAVHLGYSAPGFHTLLDSRLYLPQDWAEDPVRRQNNYIPEEVEFQSKSRLALSLIDRALHNGIRVAAWTFDELYGRDSKFLDGLDNRGQAYVAEIPRNARLWTTRPRGIRKRPVKRGKGRAKKISPLARARPAYAAGNLVRYSANFQQQAWQPYRIKDTEHGPEVWEVKWLRVWRKTETRLPSRQQTLLVARNVRTGEMKFFLSNRVVGRHGVTLRWLLRVAFGRWAIEACFRVAKQELGMDHFQVRGWRCIHRHYCITALSYLFCSRVRSSLDQNDTRALTVEQVRRSVNVYLAHCHLPAPLRDDAFEKELADQRYYQKREAQAKQSHTQTRIALYRQLGIDVANIKSCITTPQNQTTPDFTGQCTKLALSN